MGGRDRQRQEEREREKSEGVRSSKQKKKCSKKEWDVITTVHKGIEEIW